MKRLIQIFLIMGAAVLLVQPAKAGDVAQTPEPIINTLSSFIAEPAESSVILIWETATEIDTVGFNLYRAESKDGEYVLINDSLIIAEGIETEGFIYEFDDEDVQNQNTYSYFLEDIDIYGVSTLHGPVSATPRVFYGEQ